MITSQSTIIELKAEAYTVLQSLEEGRAYLKQLNQLIEQKEAESKQKDEPKLPKPAETVEKT